MAISKELYQALKKVIGSPATISRRASKLIRDHGPMTAEEARWVIAHEASIDLRRFGLTTEQLDRVRQLRASIRDNPVDRSQPAPSRGDENQQILTAREAQATPAAVFSSRNFHPEVEKSSRKLYVGGHHADSIRKAFQGANNRVKRLAALTDDGQGLMSKAFAKDSPPLQMTDLSTQSKLDEHEGARFLMMGGMAAMRNPRAHEDSWETDGDPIFVLEALALASILHRFLDRCERFRKSRSVAIGSKQIPG